MRARVACSSINLNPGTALLEMQVATATVSEYANRLRMKLIGIVPLGCDRRKSNLQAFKDNHLANAEEEPIGNTCQLL